MRSSLPYELLADIVQLLFDDLPHHRVPAAAGDLELKPPWSRIHAVVLASRTLRAIGLRLWFCRLRVKSEWNWDYISCIPGVYSWVREISYHNVTALLIPSIDPNNFPALESVSIRMLNVDRPIMVIDRLPRSVKSLEIWKFDTMLHRPLFSAIASRLPDLRELRLHGICEADKFGLGTLFDSADALGRSIASSLGKAQKLQVLAMDICLTPSTILLRHASCPRGQALASCDMCIREFAEETCSNELKVSLCVAGALASLARIEWCSCFCRRHKSTLCVTRNRAGKVSLLREDEDRPDPHAAVYNPCNS